MPVGIAGRGGELDVRAQREGAALRRRKQGDSRRQIRGCRFVVVNDRARGGGLTDEVRQPVEWLPSPQPVGFERQQFDHDAFVAFDQLVVERIDDEVGRFRAGWDFNHAGDRRVILAVLGRALGAVKYLQRAVGAARALHLKQRPVRRDGQELALFPGRAVDRVNRHHGRTLHFHDFDLNGARPGGCPQIVRRQRAKYVVPGRHILPHEDERLQHGLRTAFIQRACKDRRIANDAEARLAIEEFDGHHAAIPVAGVRDDRDVGGSAEDAAITRPHNLHAGRQIHRRRVVVAKHRAGAGVTADEVTIRRRRPDGRANRSFEREHHGLCFLDQAVVDRFNHHLHAAGAFRNRHHRWQLAVVGTIPRSAGQAIENSERPIGRPGAFDHERRRVGSHQGEWIQRPRDALGGDRIAGQDMDDRLGRRFRNRDLDGRGFGGGAFVVRGHGDQFVFAGKCVLPFQTENVMRQNLEVARLKETRFEIREEIGAINASLSSARVAFQRQAGGSQGNPIARDAEALAIREELHRFHPAIAIPGARGQEDIRWSRDHRAVRRVGEGHVWRFVRGFVVVDDRHDAAMRPADHVRRDGRHERPFVQRRHHAFVALEEFVVDRRNPDWCERRAGRNRNLSGKFLVIHAVLRRAAQCVEHRDRVLGWPRAHDKEAAVFRAALGGDRVGGQQDHQRSGSLSGEDGERQCNRPEGEGTRSQPEGTQRFHSKQL